MKLSPPKTPNRLRVFRAEYDLTQWDAAQAIGCTQSHYWAIENGRTVPTDEEKARIAKLFRSTIADVFPSAAA